MFSIGNFSNLWIFRDTLAYAILQLGNELRKVQRKMRRTVRTKIHEAFCERTQELGFNGENRDMLENYTIQFAREIEKEMFVQLGPETKIGSVRDQNRIDSRKSKYFRAYFRIVSNIKQKSNGYLFHAILTENIQVFDYYNFCVEIFFAKMSPTYKVYPKNFWQSFFLRQTVFYQKGYFLHQFFFSFFTSSFLHQRFYLFTLIFCFLNQYSALFYTNIFALIFLHQSFCLFYTTIVLFYATIFLYITPTSLIFYSKFWKKMFLTLKIFFENNWCKKGSI